MIMVGIGPLIFGIRRAAADSLMGYYAETRIYIYRNRSFDDHLARNRPDNYDVRVLSVC